MNQRTVSLVGSSFILLGCLGMVSCGSNDSTTITGSGGTGTNSSSTSSVGGSSNATSSGNGSSVGGKSSSDTSGGNSSGGTGDSTGAGGSSSQGGTDAAGGQSANEGGSTSSKGGATGNGGASTGAGGKTGTGGSSSKGGNSAAGGSSNTAAGGSSPAGGSSSSNVGGSAAGGTSSSSTSAAGATSKPVTPTGSGSDYKFTLPSCNNLVMDVNPTIGARMSKLMLGSTNIIVPFTCTSYDGSGDCNKSGTTFWTSPQTAWPGATWPPVKAIDGDAYTPAINGTHLVATGSADSSLGASVVKDFSADDGTCWVTIQYTIKATKSLQVAPWQISRVTRGGLAFFPAGPKTVPGPLDGTTTTTTTTTPSVVWFDDKTKTLSGSGGSKLIADGSGGWLAYALSGNLLIIKYPDVQSGSIAPAEGDVEIYADSTGYIELEVQGPYTSLSANGTLPWTVQMRAVPIPSSVTVAAGNAGLLSFVQEQVAK